MMKVHDVLKKITPYRNLVEVRADTGMSKEEPTKREAPHLLVCRVALTV
jgi:hypothetical protein